MKREELEASLTGCPYANVVEVSKHYTPEFLAEECDDLWGATSRMEQMGVPINYRPSELTKCLIHYCSRNLISSLWEYSLPVFKHFVEPNGRFALDKALAAGGNPALIPRVTDNLDLGQKFILDVTSKLHDNWVRLLGQRDRDDLLAMMYPIYKLHSVLIVGEWGLPTILDTTFTSASRENFEWVRDYPNMTRPDLEEITENSYGEAIEQANGLGVILSAKELVARNAFERGDLPYVLDQNVRKIVFNPELDKELADEEKAEKAGYYDQTQLVLMCPAKFVPSSLYPKGSMLHDLLRFRYGIYTELYLETHGRR